MFASVFYCKNKLQANFHKKILIFESPRIFWKWKLWCPCSGARCAHQCQYFGFRLLKSYLTFGYFTCSIRSKKIPRSTIVHSNPHSLILTSNGILVRLGQWTILDISPYLQSTQDPENAMKPCEVRLQKWLHGWGFLRQTKFLKLCILGKMYLK